MVVPSCTSCNDKCDCRKLNNHKHVEVVRYSKVKWEWTPSHDLALTQCASSMSTDPVPTEIVAMIKQHCFHPQQPLFVIRPIIRHEPYHGIKPQDLLRQKLCAHSKQFYQQNACALTVSLHSSDTSRSTQMFSCLRTHSLPALNLQMQSGDGGEPFWRTVFVDNVQLKFELKWSSQEGSVSNSAMHIIALHDEDSVNWINDTCKRIWNDTQCMSNVFIFNQSRKHKKLVQQVADYWNIACFQASSNRTQPAKNVLQFAVKYHWFSHVGVA
eukprot:CAMPEP_0197073474 /NCGR_PEP_ID=MMETSP1384-20130603/210625_1 /TAXON_ID=29189 /ORGANISM="Ammonia sp." /LENGTH=269 /DNA_ID=CAMNT_0042512311 /DNA_START=25 /DNA_END=834 /DNA_ORIENTATION=+